jgi:hypothetical protein
MVLINPHAKPLGKKFFVCNQTFATQGNQSSETLRFMPVMAALGCWSL